MILQIFDVVVSGLLLGGIYSLIAVGLSLQYGVARVLNIAHGDFIMIGAFITWAMYTMLGINPLLCAVVSAPFGFLIGYFVYRTMFTRLRTTALNVGMFEGNSMLAAFGLSFVIQNIVLLIFGADFKAYSFLNISVNVFGALFSVNRLVALAFAVGLGLLFYLFLAFTRLGKAIRAAAQDANTAGLMGVNINQVLALCFGFGAAMAGIAGLLVSMCYPINPSIGSEYLIIAIIVVVLGGLGSIIGSFIGGLILGLIGSIVAYIDPSLSLAAYYVLFIILLLVRPTGILGR